MKKLITMLSVLTITSSTASFAVACNSKLKRNPTKELSIDINKITAEEIINVQSEYKGKNDQWEVVTVTSDKLGSLSNMTIENLLKMNLSSMFMNKLTGIGIEETKINDLKKIINFDEKEKIDFITYKLLEICAISFNVKSDKNNKKFTATIEINDKNKSFEKNEIMENKINDYFVKASLEKGLTFGDVHSNTVFFKKWIQTDDFTLVKSMYDLIKGTSATIDIDLTDKQ